IFGGCTIGRKLVKARLINKDGEKPTIAVLLLRNFLKAVSRQLFGVLFWVSLILKNKTVYDAIVIVEVIMQQ
ncbi:MAG: RDD family protein, partial [Clostridiales bacterium]|nr:RDD family protein [Clostridiales bacterium]